jgi:hypothetical protein
LPEEVHACREGAVENDNEVDEIHAEGDLSEGGEQPVAEEVPDGIVFAAEHGAKAAEEDSDQKEDPA